MVACSCFPAAEWPTTPPEHFGFLVDGSISETRLQLEKNANESTHAKGKLYVITKRLCGTLLETLLSCVCIWRACSLYSKYVVCVHQGVMKHMHFVFMLKNYFLPSITDCMDSVCACVCVRVRAFWLRDPSGTGTGDLFPLLQCLGGSGGGVIRPIWSTQQQSWQGLIYAEIFTFSQCCCTLGHVVQLLLHWQDSQCCGWQNAQCAVKLSSEYL